MEGKTATVFGGTGFVGHAVVQALAERGYRVRVPTRELQKADDLLPMGAMGQIVPFAANVKTDAAVAEALRGSSVVLNLIGELVERGKNGFQLAHVETAARLARIAKAEGVQAFVHVSALGADARSPSRYARSKALGEEAVRAFFPDASILRPSVMFGPRDVFFNRFALYARYLPFLPLIGGGHTKFQPIYVGDVARAIVAAAERQAAQGQLFVLGGPRLYSFKELMQMVLAQTGRRAMLLNVPWGVAMVQARLLELLPNPPLTRDQVELLKTDNIVRAQHAGRAPALENLGITPTCLEDILPTYLA